MKKTVKIVVMSIFMSATGYGIYTNQKVNTVSDLMLANIEALAEGESTSDGKIPYSYYETISETKRPDGKSVIVSVHHVRCLPGGNERCSNSDTQFTTII